MNSFVLVALIGAVAYAISNLLQKHLVGKIDEYAVAWSRYLFSSPFLLLFLWKIGIPKVNPGFWPLVVIIGLVEIVIAIIFTKALKSASISKTIPFLAFNPFFIAIGGFIILHETLSWLQVFSICLIVVGSYVLNIEKENVRDILAPLKLIWKEKSGLYIMCLSVIWGLDIPFSKQATLYSSPVFFSTIFFVLTSIFFIPLFMKKSKHGWNGIKKNFLGLSVTGFLTSVFMVALFIAAKMGPIAVVDAIISTNILITVLLAGKLMKESNIKQRLIAALIMTAGAILLSIS